MWPFRRRRLCCADEARVARAVAVIDDLLAEQYDMGNDRNWEMQDRLLEVRAVLTGPVSRRARRELS